MSQGLAGQGDQGGGGEGERDKIKVDGVQFIVFSYFYFRDIYLAGLGLSCGMQGL